MSAASEGRGEWVGWTESDIFRGGTCKDVGRGAE